MGRMSVVNQQMSESASGERLTGKGTGFLDSWRGNRLLTSLRQGYAAAGPASLRSYGGQAPLKRVSREVVAAVVAPLALTGDSARAITRRRRKGLKNRRNLRMTHFVCMEGKQETNEDLSQKVCLCWQICGFYRFQMGTKVLERIHRPSSRLSPREAFNLSRQQLLTVP
jgi:hypothetical protein